MYALRATPERYSVRPCVIYYTFGLTDGARFPRTTRTNHTVPFIQESPAQTNQFAKSDSRAWTRLQITSQLLKTTKLRRMAQHTVPPSESQSKLDTTVHESKQDDGEGPETKKTTKGKTSTTQASAQSPTPSKRKRQRSAKTLNAFKSAKQRCTASRLIVEVFGRKVDEVRKR